TLDLREGERYLSKVDRTRLRLAYGTKFYDVSGTAHSDRIYGNALGNRLMGQAGHDRINGDAGGDLLIGGAGDDRLEGGAGGDTFFFEAGDADTNDFSIRQWWRKTVQQIASWEPVKKAVKWIEHAFDVDIRLPVHERDVVEDFSPEEDKLRIEGEHIENLRGLVEKADIREHRRYWLFGPVDTYITLPGSGREAIVLRGVRKTELTSSNVHFSDNPVEWETVGALSSAASSYPQPDTSQASLEASDILTEAGKEQHVQPSYSPGAFGKERATGLL
ncbi:MAG: calcium-binding protein, partial [Leptospiraceae bacterium]|nr:calcium-binding protein [Leptospiraceae bacterium]